MFLVLDVKPNDIEKQEGHVYIEYYDDNFSDCITPEHDFVETLISKDLHLQLKIK